MSAYQKALLITLALEVPIVALVYSRIRLRMAVVAAVATFLTHYVMHQPARSFFAALDHPILYAEGAVVIAEAVIYFGSSRHEHYEGRRATLALGASLAANAVSYIGGLYLL